MEYVAVDIGAALAVHSVYQGAVLATIGTVGAEKIAFLGGPTPGVINTGYPQAVGVSEKKWGLLANVLGGGTVDFPIRRKRGATAFTALTPSVGHSRAEAVYLHDNGDVYGVSIPVSGIGIPVVWPAASTTPVELPVPTPGNHSVAIGNAYGSTIVWDTAANSLYAKSLFAYTLIPADAVVDAGVSKGKVFGTVLQGGRSVAVEFTPTAQVPLTQNQRPDQTSECLCYGRNFFAGAFGQGGRTFGITFGAKNGVGWTAVRDRLNLLVDQVDAISEENVLAGMGRNFTTGKKVAWRATLG